MPTPLLKSLKEKTKIPTFGDLLIISVIIIFVILLQLTSNINSVVIAWFYNNEGKALKEIAVNGIIVCLLFGIYSIRRVTQYKKMIRRQLITEANLQSSQQQMAIVLNNSSTIVYTADPSAQNGNKYI